MVLVSYIEFLFTNGFCSEYVVLYARVYRSIISPARQVLCVPSHMYYSQSRLIACVKISVSLLSNQLLVCFLHTSTAV